MALDEEKLWFRQMDEFQMVSGCFWAHLCRKHRCVSRGVGTSRVLLSILFHSNDSDAFCPLFPRHTSPQPLRGAATRRPELGRRRPRGSEEEAAQREQKRWRANVIVNHENSTEVCTTPLGMSRILRVLKIPRELESSPKNARSRQ